MNHDETKCVQSPSIDAIGLDHSDFGPVHAHRGVSDLPETWRWVILTFSNKELGIQRVKTESQQNKMHAATKYLCHGIRPQ